MSTQNRGSDGEGRTERFLLRLSPAEYADTKAMAQTVGWSTNSLIVNALQAYKTAIYGTESPAHLLRSARSAYGTVVNSQVSPIASSPPTDSYLNALSAFSAPLEPEETDDSVS